MTGHTRDELAALSDSLYVEERVAAKEETTRLLTFMLGAERLGVTLTRTRAIVRVAEVTPIPESPPHVRGIANVRGRIVPVVDLRLILGWGASELGPAARLILVDARERVLALLVESVRDIRDVPVRSIAEAPEELAPAGAHVIRGVSRHDAQQPLIVVDTDALLDLRRGDGPRAGDPR